MKRDTFLFPFYASTFIQTVLKLIVPFYIIYFVDLGLDFRQIALISSVSSAVGLISEVPTGVVADLYGKKVSVILGLILSAVAIFFVPFAQNFVQILVILSLQSLFYTLCTGADEAWVSDIIEKENLQIMNEFFFKRTSIKNLGIIISGLIGGLVVKFLGMDYLRFFYGIGLIVSASFLFFVPDGIKGYSEDGESLLSKSFWRHLKGCVEYLGKNRLLLILFGAMGLFLMIDELIGLIWTPHLEELGFNIENLGYLSSVFGVFGIFVPLLVKKFLKKDGKSALFLGYFFITFAVLLLVGGVCSSIWLILGLYFLYTIFVDNVLFPVDLTLCNKLINQHKKATVLSVKSMIEDIITMLGAPCMGWILGFLTFSQGLLWSGILMSVLAIFYFVIGTKLHHIKV